MRRGSGRHWFVGALTACALGAGSASAAAAESSAAESAESATAESAADAERAKRLYELGAEAFAAQRNGDAIAYFRRAAELVPSAKLTYNIALAYEEMGDAARALGAYREYLRQEPGGERSDAVHGRITALEQRLARTGVQQLSVTSRPAGATVRVDARAVGLTPWTGELAPGPHVIELELAGHVARRADVVLAPERSSELSLELAPAEIDARSRWARVTPLTWTFLGVGAAALSGGVMFELSRASSSDQAERAGTPLAEAEARGAADAKQMASLLLLGFGGGFLVGGGVLLALDLSADDADAGAAPSAALGCGAGFCGVLTQGHF